MTVIMPMSTCGSDRGVGEGNGVGGGWGVREMGWGGGEGNGAEGGGIFGFLFPRLWERGGTRWV